MKQRIEKAKKFVKEHKRSILIGVGSATLITLGLATKLNGRKSKLNDSGFKNAIKDCEWESLGYKVCETGNGFRVKDLGKYGELLLESGTVEGITADSELTSVYLTGLK